jgi:16S rRNA (uracil1498-N3)-methyltransferase
LSSASVFIGPEGGFSPEEVQRLKESGAIFASLGPRILRAETAAIIATALLMYELGDLGRA